MEALGASDYCENCGSPTSWQIKFASPSTVWECPHCQGWRYGGELQAPAADTYDRDYFFGKEYLNYELSRSSHDKNFRRKLKLLARAGVPIDASTRLVEIGCATGEFLRAAQDLGVTESIGVEVSDYARQTARDRGFNVLSPSDSTLRDRARVLEPNLIVAWDVWEHLERPATTLDQYLSLAAPRAFVAVTSVDAGSFVARHRGTRWRQFHPPTHLNYPTRRSLRRFLELRGLGILTHQSFGYYRPAFEYLSALTGRLGRNAIRQGLFSWPIYLNLYDTQLIVGSRSARGSND